MGVYNKYLPTLFLRSMNKHVGSPFIGVSRHRIFTDGEGVTTLVAFHSCPLRCKYCLNPQSLEKKGITAWYTPMTLLKEVEKDGIYFDETDGGITFGGGEPLLYPEFIKEFRQICPLSWKINVETSLNVSQRILADILDVIDTYIIDIKDMNPVVYERYTGRSNQAVIDNLHYLVEQGKADNMLVRTPLIPGYNNDEDVFSSICKLEKLGIKKYERLTYKRNKIDETSLDAQLLYTLGKSKCKILKNIRMEVAKRNSITYVPKECNNTKPCSGTCPACERELKYINDELSNGRKEFT